MHVTDHKERNDLANSLVSDAIHAQVTHHNDTIDTDGTTRKAHVKKMLLENDSQIRRKEAVKLRRFGREAQRKEEAEKVAELYEEQDYDHDPGHGTKLN